MDDGLSQLQKLIEEELRRDFSDTAIDYAMNPRNPGKMDDADGWARHTGPCGDTMEVWIALAGDEIREARFWTDGCGSSIAAGGMVTELAGGKSLSGAMEIGKRDVLEGLGGLPGEYEHCAQLAAATLKLAVRDCLNKRREPWRKFYGDR